MSQGCVGFFVSSQVAICVDMMRFRVLCESMPWCMTIDNSSWIVEVACLGRFVDVFRLRLHEFCLAPQRLWPFSNTMCDKHAETHKDSDDGNGCEGEMKVLSRMVLLSS